MERQALHSSDQITLTGIRFIIDGLLKARRYDDIGQLPGFSLIDRAENRPGADCDVYVFGAVELIRPGKENVHAHYKQVDKPEAGDIVFYYDADGNWQHTGLASGPETVVSKFGLAHVYEHPVNAVPTFYGNTVKFYRNPVRGT